MSDPNPSLTQQQKDILRLMPGLGAPRGLPDEDLQPLLDHVQELRIDAATLSLWERGEIVMRMLDGVVMYYATENDPLLKETAQ